LQTVVSGGYDESIGELHPNLAERGTSPPVCIINVRNNFSYHYNYDSAVCVCAVGVPIKRQNGTAYRTATQHVGLLKVTAKRVYGGRLAFAYVWFLPRDALHKRGLCRRKMSVCLSVTRRYVDTVKHIKLVSPRGGATILVFAARCYASAAYAIMRCDGFRLYV